MANAISALVSGDAGEYDVAYITMSPSSGQYLNFSAYVKDYNNIVAILWKGSASSTSNVYYCLYSDGFAKKANNDGQQNPNRILALHASYFNTQYKPFGSSSSYLCFKPEEWEAGGNIGVYGVNYQGEMNASPYAIGYSTSYVYLVYKREDT